MLILGSKNVIYGDFQTPKIIQIYISENETFLWDWQDFETKSHGLFIFGSLYITEGYSILWFSMAKINVWGLLLLRALYMLPNYVFASNHSGEITEISLRHFCQQFRESIGFFK